MSKVHLTGNLDFTFDLSCCPKDKHGKIRLDEKTFEASLNANIQWLRIEALRKVNEAIEKNNQ